MIKNLSQLKDELSKCRGTWAWVGQRGIDVFSVLDFVSVDAGFCCDFGDVYPGIFGGESLFSVEKDHGRRENWGNKEHGLLSFARGIRKRQTLSCVGSSLDA